MWPLHCQLRQRCIIICSICGYDGRCWLCGVLRFGHGELRIGFKWAKLRVDKARYHTFDLYYSWTFWVSFTWWLSLDLFYFFYWRCCIFIRAVNDSSTVDLVFWTAGLTFTFDLRKFIRDFQGCSWCLQVIFVLDCDVLESESCIICLTLLRLWFFSSWVNDEIDDAFGYWAYSRIILNFL